jgi:hypothetical protein
MSDMQRIFDLDPLECTDQDILALINGFRNKQAQFKSGTLDAGRTKPRAASKAKAPTIKSDLSDLGL